MDDKTKKRVGAFVRKKREAKGLNTHQLAAQVRVPQAFISRIENGVRGASAETLARIAEALDTPLADLYGLAGYAVPKELPAPSIYLRAKFRDLPPKELAAVARDVERAFKAHGIDPSASPMPGEDEHPQPKAQRGKSPTKKSKKGGKK